MRLTNSGVEISVMSIEDARCMGIHREDLQPLPYRLYAADGRAMQRVGQCNVKLQLGNVTRIVGVSVVPHLHCPLLSGHGAIGFRILPAEFPAQVCGVGREMPSGDELPLLSEAGHGAAPTPPSSGAVQLAGGVGVSSKTELRSACYREL